MNILLWIVFGAIAGWVASLIMGTDARQGAVANILLGIVGGLIGGLIMNLFGSPGVTGLNFYSMVVAVIGAVSLIWLGRVLSA
jgi:uncharacterized membrane protein YeaQ/YmgE (transglycosylase-associated protein family)